MKISFIIYHQNDPDTVRHQTNTLGEMVKYIQTHINIPLNWLVEELEDGEFCDICNAQYLLTYMDVYPETKTITEMK